jgi:hypothetical protein
LYPPTPYGVPIQPQTAEKLCSRIAKHLENCKKCSRKYSNDTNTYISIIVGLILFIMFLLTKIIDKFGG